MASIVNLDDINQKVFYIPYSSPEDHGESQTEVPPPYSPFQERDLPDGHELRLQAYRAAWNKCLDRFQNVIRALHAPVASAVVQHIRTAYSDILPGLPYAELPVVSITGSTSGSSFLNEITCQLDQHNEDEDLFSETPLPDAFVTHLHSTDCPNIMASMKALITGFVERSPNPDKVPVKRKPATSLASYDIQLLKAWYEEVREVQGSTTESLSKLVVFLHDFEQFDPLVVQDMFYICSLHIPFLPLVFILSLSSPPSPSYLHLAYPRSTLALLHVRNFIIPSGNEVLEECLLRTFFDLEFEPDIVIGPGTLDFLAEYSTRHNSSIDSALTILQLAHMKHFEDPLTIFALDTLLGTSNPTLSLNVLLQPTSFAFLDAVLARLHNPTDGPSENHAHDWRNQDIPSLLSSLDNAREEFYARARRMRVGFRLMRLVQAFMFKHGYKSADSDRTSTVPSMMSAAMKGRLGRDVKYLGLMAKKLPAPKFTTLLGELEEFFQNLPPRILGDEGPARVKIAESIALIQAEPDALGIVAENLGEWLIGYLTEQLENLEASMLWDIWYTGLSPFPSELINPSLRASILSGLLHPYDYTDANSPGFHEHEQQPGRAGLSIWQLPDTSILFRRYLDSGKMINVYDWFESFVLVLETQRRRLKSGKTGVEAHHDSPRKGKSKQKQKEVNEGEEDEEDEEKWKLEVQARFMRALHELDYLGFIKHTGRKADHVLRTVFDILS